MTNAPTFPPNPDRCPDSDCPGTIEEHLDAPGTGFCTNCGMMCRRDDFDKWARSIFDDVDQ